MCVFAIRNRIGMELISDAAMFFVLQDAVIEACNGRRADQSQDQRNL